MAPEGFLGAAVVEGRRDCVGVERRNLSPAVDAQPARAAGLVEAAARAVGGGADVAAAVATAAAALVVVPSRRRARGGVLLLPAGLVFDLVDLGEVGVFWYEALVLAAVVGCRQRATRVRAARDEGEDVPSLYLQKPAAPGFGPGAEIGGCVSASTLEFCSGPEARPLLNPEFRAPGAAFRVTKPPRRAGGLTIWIFGVEGSSRAALRGSRKAVVWCLSGAVRSTPHRRRVRLSWSAMYARWNM